MSMKLTLLGSICLSPILLLTSSASANVVDTYGLSAKSVALGNAFTAGGDSTFAAYSNPASLTDQPNTSVSVGYQYTNLNLKGLNGNAKDDNSGLPASNYDASEAEAVTGSTFGLNLAITPTVHFGIAGYMPTGNFGKLSGSAPNEINYLRYSDRQQRPAIYTAAAAKFGSLSVGLGSFYTLKASGVLSMALNNKASAARFDLEMIPVMSFYGGLQWSQKTDFGAFKIGGMYRAAQATESNIDTYLSVGAVGEQNKVSVPMEIQTKLVPFYDPELFRLGLNVEHGQLAFYASTELARWSKYKAPIVQLNGEDIASLTDEASDVSVDLGDTLAYKLGLAFDVKDRLNTQIRFGLEQHESATGNKVDNGIIDLDRTAVAIGVGFQIFDSSLPEGRVAHLDFSYQRSILAEEGIGNTDSELNAGGNIDTLIGGVRYEL